MTETIKLTWTWRTRFGWRGNKGTKREERRGCQPQGGRRESGRCCTPPTFFPPQVSHLSKASQTKPPIGKAWVLSFGITLLATLNTMLGEGIPQNNVWFSLIWHTAGVWWAWHLMFCVTIRVRPRRFQCPPTMLKTGQNTPLIPTRKSQVN